MHFIVTYRPLYLVVFVSARSQIYRFHLHSRFVFVLILVKDLFVQKIAVYLLSFFVAYRENKKTLSTTSYFVFAFNVCDFG